MSKAPKLRPEQTVLVELRERLTRLREILPTLSRPAATTAMAELLAIMGVIEEARGDLDPIKEPGASFDPTNPDTAGRLVALALVAQDKVPLARIARTYGSGVYAIYYHGDHPASPPRAAARTSREQGPQLYGRLADHRRMIKTVGDYASAHNLPHPLKVDDFTCHRLVCATNAQLVAERHLIRTFTPIWNNEMGICWGISKHGDAATTRANKRSPWDVMHPGRTWAMAESLEDKMSPEVITAGIAEHFKVNPPHRSRARIVRGFLSAFVQNAAMTAAETTGDEHAVASAVSGELPPME